MSKIKMMKKTNLIKYALYFYTVVLFLISITITSSILQNPKNKVVAEGEYCDSADDCFGLSCEYPAATYCTARSEEPDDISKCRCRDWNNQPYNGCAGDPYQEPPGCPSGMIDCGTSGHRTDGDPACTQQGSVRPSCPGCNNPTVVYRYCKPGTPPNEARCFENCDGKTCVDGTQCINGLCRNPECQDDSDCSCDEPPAEARCFENCDGKTCVDGTQCINGLCRNPECQDDSDCSCDAPPTPVCGDAKCDEGEKCERTAANANTFKACQRANQGAPTGASVECRNVNNRPVTANSCVYCGDGIRQASETCDYAVDANCTRACDWNGRAVTIDKEVLNKETYNVGEVANFQIRITNNIDATFNRVQFSDRYNPSYLRLISGYATSSSGKRVDNLLAVLDVNRSGFIQINNIARNELLGPLTPNGYYDIYLSFIVLNAIDSTCNTGYTKPGDLDEISDRDCLNSRNQDTDL
jgi:uncharacterized repeat protein (TIGR01451 family)